ncbi:MAG: DUF1015 domain-containing protein [Myxococcota bacterium]
MRTYESAGIAVPEVLLPKAELSHTKWAVVACDQYTSEPEYWEEVAKTVGDAPSTLSLIYPEVYLGEAEPEKRIENIRSSMEQYLRDGILVGHDGMVYVERVAAGKTRKGLVLCVDLEQYDYNKGSNSLIRATEGTILERLPPRIKIRKGAPLELPHIMVLIDDPENTVLGPLTDKKGSMDKLYDFDLMMNAGHLIGYRVDAGQLEASVVQALEKLADPDTFTKKYDLAPKTPVLLYAMGDGNHSLATAKAIWEQTKEEAADKQSVMQSPTRYALVELVNLHDEALEFEPIHRVLFELAEGKDLLGELLETLSGELRTVDGVEAMEAEVRKSTPEAQRFGVIRPQGYAVVDIGKAPSNLPVGSLQSVLDPFMKAKGAREIDYVHGTAAVDKLGKQSGNMGFFLPPMNKHDLFKTVIVDGALPRKTFSMGEADEKRFYMECRKLT